MGLGSKNFHKHIATRSKDDKLAKTQKKHPGLPQYKRITHQT